MVIKSNKKVLHDYDIHEEFEAGLVLNGSQVKSIRSSKFEISESAVNLRNDQIFIDNMVFDNADNQASIKLLLHKKEIEKIKSIKKEKRIRGLVASIMTRENKIKAKIIFGIIKRKIDKKQEQKRSTQKRILEREIKKMVI